MRSKTKIKIILLAFMAMFAFKSVGQVDERASYIFSGDSIAGFDEAGNSAIALSERLYGIEYKFFMYNQKRAFVKQKYNLNCVKTFITL